MSSHSPNYTTVEAFIAHVLATWARQKGRFTTEKFNAGLWEIIKGLLEEFVQHMEDKAARGLIDVLGANCDNVFWDHRDDSKAYLKDFTEQDRVTCRIMSAALTFMSTVRDAGQLGQTRNETDKDMRQILGCTVMHVFASILRSTTCAATSNGINYAWRTMKRVDAGFRDTAGAGALASARCEKGGWKGLTIGSGQIRTAVDAWLSHNTDLWTKLRQLHGNENCRRNKSNNDELATGAKVGQGAGVTGSAGIAKEIVTVVKDVFDKMKDDVIEKSKSSPALPGAAERGGAAGVSGTGGLELGIELPEGKSNVGGSYGPGTPQDPHTPQNTPTSPSPDVPDLTGDILTATTPVLFFLSAVTVALLGYSLWKYFAYLGQTRRRTYRTVRDVPSPPLDEEILQHLQRRVPPPDYGYKMIKDTHPASTSGTGRPPRVHKRTIIELDLEVLHECEATEWESVKDHYLQILVEEFARDLQQDAKGYSSFPDAPTTNQDLLGNNVSSTVDPPTDTAVTDPCPPHDPDPWSCMEAIELATDPSASDADDPDPWRCMETIQLPTHPCPPHDPDPWSCMDTIQLAKALGPPHDCDPWSCMDTIQLDAQKRRAHSNHREATSACTQWINWIDRHKHILRACTTQPWLLQLKSAWKQYLREHMAANEDNVHRELSEQRSIGCVEMKKDAWKKWVVKQHHDMAKYIENDWFRHLLENIDQETVPDKGAVPPVDKVMGTEDTLRVRDLPQPQPLHEDSYKQTQLIAKLWMLILAFVIEQCELESRLQEKELYVDELLDHL
ncbi:hypothetical protein AK88_04685 [Plasmodium fragile]|uniref:Schizont-infected cell agglutination C-terminal domain-containing protein n=1 Tax=Plasmodium fragile TaxID=5857 RepID=A0A0D9QF87_PLAFR|nr:uncharacterized protein AK88_04685 [Plasmodium fragile]KJP85654.1 hypothetical protein AK88_04685 [Plasmodium fragile]